MKPTPPGWARINPALFYDDAPAAIDFICRAFGFERVLVVEGDGGRIEHSELRFGDGLVQVGSSGGNSSRGPEFPGVSPRQVGGKNTMMLALFVDDADAHCARAREAGAVIVDEPTTTDYGDDHWADRTYRAMDPEGTHWWFMQRVRGPGA